MFLTFPVVDYEDVIYLEGQVDLKGLVFNADHGLESVERLIKRLIVTFKVLLDLVNDSFTRRVYKQVT